MLRSFYFLSLTFVAFTFLSTLPFINIFTHAFMHFFASPSVNLLSFPLAFLSKSLDSLHPSALIMDRMQLQHYRIHGGRSWDTAVFGASVKPTPAKIFLLAIAQRPALGALADSFCPKSPFCFSCANVHTPTHLVLLYFMESFNTPCLCNTSY